MERNAMTVKEMAAYLGVHTDTVYEMVRLNEVPHYKIRRKIFFSQVIVEAWIREQELKNYYDDTLNFSDVEK